MTILPDRWDHDVLIRLGCARGVGTASARRHNLVTRAQIRSRARMGAAVDLKETLGVDSGIDLCGRERRVAKQLLDRAQIAAAGEEMRGKRMA
jgi:hypothetical protein